MSSYHHDCQLAGVAGVGVAGASPFILQFHGASEVFSVILRDQKSAKLLPLWRPCFEGLIDLLGDFHKFCNQSVISDQGFAVVGDSGVRFFRATTPQAFHMEKKRPLLIEPTHGYPILPESHTHILTAPCMTRKIIGAWFDA